MKKTTQSIYLFATALAGATFATHSANATVLAQYDFGGTSLADSAGSSDADADTIVGDLSFSSTAFLRNSDSVQRIFFTTNATFGNPAPAWQLANDGVNTNLADAISEGDFFSFTIDPNGNSVSLTNLTFDGYRNNGSSNANVTFHLFSDIDGFTAGDVIGSDVIDQQAIVSGSIDLSGSQFQNISSATTFRIYATDNGTDSFSRVAFDNIVLNGTVSPIPEPSTVWGSLVIAGAAFFCVSRRRAKK